MSGITEERVRLIIEAESAKAVRAFLETAKKQEDLEKAAKEGAKRRAEIEEEYSRKFKQFGETRLQAVKREYSEALAEAERYGAKRTDIEKYYDKQIAQARRESIVSGADAAIGFGNKMTLGVTAPLLAAAGAGLKFAASIETQQARFSVLFGSAEKGTEVLEKLRKLGAETPLQLGDLTQATQTLAGFKAIGDDLTGTLRMIGDLAMGDAGKMQSLSLAYGQMTAAGKANMQDINQVINAGVPILDALKQKLGVETVAEVKKAVEQGLVSADMVKGAFQDLTAEGGLFNGMMMKISETTEGKLSTALDNLKNAGASAMEGLLPLAIDLLEGVSGAAEAFTNLDDSSKKAILTLIGIAAGIGPLTTVTGSVIKLGAQLSKLKAIQSLVSAGALGPVGLAAGAVVALTAVVIAARAAQAKWNEEQKQLALSMDEAEAKAKSLGEEYQILTDKKQRSGDEELRLLELGKQLKEQYPGLTREVLERATAEGKLADELERASRAQALDAYKTTYKRLDKDVDDEQKKLQKGRKELAEIEKELAERQAEYDRKPSQSNAYGLELWKINKQEQEAWLADQQIAWQKAKNARDEFNKTFWENYQGDPKNKPQGTTAGATLPTTSSGGLASRGERLQELEAAWNSERELARRMGQDITDIDRKHYQERQKLLESFIEEDRKKNKGLGESLASDIDGSYGTIEKELRSTLSNLAALQKEGEKTVREVFEEASKAWEKGQRETGNLVSSGLLSDKDAIEARQRLADSFTRTVGALDLSSLTTAQKEYFTKAVAELAALNRALDAPAEKIIDWTARIKEARDTINIRAAEKTVFDTVSSALNDIVTLDPSDRLARLKALAEADGQENAFDELVASLVEAGITGDEAVGVLEELKQSLGEAADPASELLAALEGVGGTLGTIAAGALKAGIALAKAFNKDIVDDGAFSKIAQYLKENVAGISAVSSAVSGLYSEWKSAAEDAATAGLKANIEALEDELSEHQEFSDRQLALLEQNGEDTVSFKIRQKQEEKRLNEQLAKAEDELNRKQFEQQKQNKLAEIAISTAVGIAGALPNLILAGIVGAAGAIQAGMVASQKYTALYDGGILPGTTSGTVIAGERGYDEMVLPLRPERLRELGITGGGNVFNFYMTLGAGTTREMAREVWDYIKEFAREGEAA